MIIGITGATGSGKTTIATKVVEKLGNASELVSIDEIGHDVTAIPEIKNKLVKKFGTGILNENKEIDSKKLGAIVFNDDESMDFLTKITWPKMERMIFQKMRNTENKYLILEYSLLPLAERVWAKCDFRILIKRPDKIRMEGLILRDKVSASYLRSREKDPLDYSEFRTDIDKTFKNVNHDDVNKAALSIVAEIAKLEKINKGVNITRGIGGRGASPVGLFR